MSAGRGLLAGTGRQVSTKGPVIPLSPWAEPTLLTLDFGLPVSAQRGLVFSEPQAAGRPSRHATPLLQQHHNQCISGRTVQERGLLPTPPVLPEDGSVSTCSGPAWAQYYGCPLEWAQRQMRRCKEADGHTPKYPIQNKKHQQVETSLVVQWLRLCTPSAGGPGSIPP